jgi:hypothetical protein
MPNYMAFWRGKVQLVLRHHLDGMAISFNELFEHLQEWDASYSHISEKLLWDILKDEIRFEVITTIRALPSRSWRPRSRPQPSSFPSHFVPKPRSEPSGIPSHFMPKTPAEESIEGSDNASLKEEIMSESSPSSRPPPTKKKKHTVLKKVKKEFS